jgi:cell division protein FtsQ
MSRGNKRKEASRLNLVRDNKSAPARNVRIESRPTKNIRMEPRPARTRSFPWRRLGGVCLGVGVMCFLVLFIAGVSFGLLYSYKDLTTNSWFALKTLEIHGNSRVSSKDILEITGLDHGANLLALRLDQVENTVIRNPWVRGVSVKRVLPDKLVIGLEEKTPVFWVLHSGSLHYADAWGSPIAPVKAGKFASLPALEVESGAEDATRALPDLVKSLQESQLPLSLASVSWVRLSASRGVEVYLEDSRLKLTIGLEEWLPNLRRLGKTIRDLSQRGELADVREIKAQGANVWVEKSPVISSSRLQEHYHGKG